MEGNNVSLGVDFVQGNVVALLFQFRILEDVVGDHLSAEAFHDLHEDLTDVTRTNNPNHLVTNFAADGWCPTEVPVFDLFV